MAYLLLYGTGGWTARWQIAPEDEDAVRAEILRVGGSGSSELTMVDPASDAPARLVVSWGAIAAAVLIDSDVTPPHSEGSGQYA
jgi:hypothetical protein